MRNKETLKEFLEKTRAEFSPYTEYVSVFTKGLTDSQINRLFRLSDFEVIGLYKGPSYRLYPRRLITGSLRPNRRQKQKASRKNPPGVLIGDSVETIIYRKGQPHKCDAQCKAADHRYIHDTESFQTALWGSHNGKRVFLEDFS